MDAQQFPTFCIDYTRDKTGNDKFVLGETQKESWHSYYDALLLIISKSRVVQTKTFSSECAHLV